MRGFLLTVVTVFLLSSKAFAHVPVLGGFQPWCSQAYRADSYGRGLESGYQGGTLNLRPQVNDEGCYRLGLREGARIRVQGPKEVLGCERDYADGHADAMDGEVETVRSMCSHGGYVAGAAALRVGAREGDSAVGAACLKEYARGLDDGRNFRVGTPRETRGRLRECYLTGHSDANVLP